MKTLYVDDLYDFDKVLAFGKSFEGQMHPVRETEVTLKTNINDNIVTQGATALGPGALASVGLAIGNQPQGSQIILCTDGMANQGIGNFSGGNKQAANQFYQ